MLTITCILALSALVAAILALMGKCPLTVPVLLTTIVELIHCIPLQ